MLCKQILVFGFSYTFLVTTNYYITSTYRDYNCDLCGLVEMSFKSFIGYLLIVIWAFFYCVLISPHCCFSDYISLRRTKIWSTFPCGLIVWNILKDGSIKPSWSIRRNAMRVISQHSLINLHLQRHRQISASASRNPSLSFFSSAGRIFRESDIRDFWFPGLPAWEFPWGIQEQDPHNEVWELVQVQETGGQRVFCMPVEIRRGFRDQQAKMWPLVSQNMLGEMDRLLEHHLPTL